MDAPYRKLDSSRFTRDLLTATSGTALLSQQFFAEGAWYDNSGGVATLAPIADRSVVKPATQLVASTAAGQYIGLKALWAFNRPDATTEPNLQLQTDNLVFTGDGVRTADTIGNHYQPAAGTAATCQPQATLAGLGINSTTNWTLFMRVQTNQDEDGTDRVLVSIPLAAGASLTLDTYSTIFEWYDGSTFTALGNRPLGVTTVVIAYDWIFGRYTTYINGTLVNTLSPPTSLDTSGKLGFGYDPRGVYANFKDKIYEVGLVTGTWTAAQASRYNSYPLEAVGVYSYPPRTAVGASLDLRWDDQSNAPTLPTVGTATSQNWAGAYPYNHQFTHDATGASALIVTASTAGSYAFSPAATFAGTAMTLLGGVQHASGNGTIWVFGLKAPYQGSGTIRVYSDTNYVDQGVTTALNLMGTDAAAPFSTVATVSGTTAVTLNLTTVYANSLIVAAAHNHYTSAGSLTVTGDANTTAWDNGTNVNHRQVGVTAAEATAAAHSLTFTAPFNGVNAIGVEVRGAVASAGTGKTAVGAGLSAQWHDRAAVSGVRDLRWNVRGTVNQASTQPWHVRGKTNQVTTAQWHVKAAAGASTSLPWNLKAAISGAVTTPWHVRGRVNQAVSAPWHVRSKVSQPITLPWHLRSAVAASTDLRFHLRNALAAGLAAQWDIQSPAAVSVALVVTWNVKQAIPAPRDLRWNVRGTVNQPITLPWHDRNRVNQPVTLPWHDRAALAGLMDNRWHVRSAVSSLRDFRWDDRVAVFATRDFRWHDKSATAAASDLRFDVRNLLTKPLDARWNLRSTLSNSIENRWHVRTATGQNLAALWHILQQVGIVSGSCDIRWNVRGTLAVPHDSRWAIRGTSSTATTLLYNIRAVTNRPLDLRWHDRTVLPGLLAAPYNVRGRTAAPTDLRWAIRLPTGRQVDLRWDDRAAAGQTAALPWSIRETLNQTVELPYGVRGLLDCPLDLPWRIFEIVIGEGSARTVIRLTGQPPAAIHLIGTQPAGTAALLGTAGSPRLTGQQPGIRLTGAAINTSLIGRGRT